MNFGLIVKSKTGITVRLAKALEHIVKAIRSPRSCSITNWEKTSTAKPAPTETALISIALPDETKVLKRKSPFPPLA